jgi:hypothetical protein
LARWQQCDAGQDLGLRDGAGVHGALRVLGKPAKHGRGRLAAHQL